MLKYIIISNEAVSLIESKAFMKCLVRQNSYVTAASSSSAGSEPLWSGAELRHKVVSTYEHFVQRRGVCRISGFVSRTCLLWPQTVAFPAHCTDDLADDDAHDGVCWREHHEDHHRRVSSSNNRRPQAWERARRHNNPPVCRQATKTRYAARKLFTSSHVNTESR